MTMKFRTLTPITQDRTTVNAFGGYNHNRTIGDGEFYDAENLSAEEYPIIKNRELKGPAFPMPQTGTIYGMVIVREQTAIDTTTTAIYTLEPGEGGVVRLFRNKQQITNMTFDGLTRKQMIMMGAYLVIFPDKKYINTSDHGDYGSLEQKNSAVTVNDSGSPYITLCMLDGSTLANEPTISFDPPASPQNGDLWIDTSQPVHSLKQYSSQQEEWVAFATCYLKISLNGIADGIRKNDAITLDGLTVGDPIVDYHDEDTLRRQVSEMNGVSYHVYEAYHGPAGYGDYIVVAGFLDEAVYPASGTVKAERSVPDMDYVIESGNRLWGCKYGLADTLHPEKGTLNEIYASKLGDFKNWRDYQLGISEDSYTASCGTEGPFTGAVNYNGKPMFFKEHYVHVVYGSYPAQYQIDTDTLKGVKKGCSETLKVVNGYLFYLSSGGVMRFNGNSAVSVSENLGDEEYGNGRAGVYKNLYYINMKSEWESKYYLFCYDTKRDIWHRENEKEYVLIYDTDVSGARPSIMFVPKRTAQDIADGKNNYVLMYPRLQESVEDAPGWTEEEDTWYAETGLIGTREPDKKYISKVNLRMQLEPGARMIIYVQYDSIGQYYHAASVTGTALKTYTLPIPLRRCDHFRMKFVGNGGMRLYSVTKTIEQGSDV